jgi:hypothetical protein
LLTDWNVKVIHEYREANKFADALTNIGCIMDHEVIFYDVSLVEVKEILLADEMGIATPRLILA